MNLTGNLGGTGPMTVTGSFRPEKPNPDFDLTCASSRPRSKRSINCCGPMDSRIRQEARSPSSAKSQ